MPKYSKYSPQIFWWKGELNDDLESEDKRLETENTIDNAVPCRKLAYHRWKLSNTLEIREI